MILSHLESSQSPTCDQLCIAMSKIDPIPIYIYYIIRVQDLSVLLHFYASKANSPQVGELGVGTEDVPLLPTCHSRVKRPSGYLPGASRD
jgi:hypothetical protein